jgi:hypothetical protein
LHDRKVVARKLRRLSWGSGRYAVSFCGGCNGAPTESKEIEVTPEMMEAGDRA